MKSLKKRVLSCAMAGVLAVSMAIPAFASGNTTEIDGSFKAVTIDVVVPSNAVAFINPYALDIEVPNDGSSEITDTTAASDKTTISGQQIVSAPMALKNKTAMDLNVAASVTGVVKTGSGMRFATESAANATMKSAYVYLQATPATALSGADSAITDANIASACAAWAKTPYSAASDVLVGNIAATQEHLVNLKAATMNAGVFSQYAAGSIALVRLTGDCPSNLRDPWVAEDGFTVTVAYTFTPATKYAVTTATTNFTATAPGNPPTTVTASPANAMPGETVTLTIVKSAAGDNLTVTVTGADGTTNVPVSALTTDAGDSTNKTVTCTFEMPEQAVTVGGTVS